MNKKKGFTLIELLAVIVILAIIALIATPLIMNIINDAKKGAFEDSSYAIINAAEQGYAKGLIKELDTSITEYEYSEGVRTLKQGNVEVNYKGSSPESGTLLINKEGEVAIAFYNNGWCITKSYSETKITTTSKNKDDCVIDSENIDTDYLEVFSTSSAENTFYLLPEGVVKAVGLNNLGQLGDGTNGNKTTPISIPNLTNVKQISSGSNHTLFLLKDGTVKAIGRNNYGQLGDGTNENKTVPITIPNMTNVKQVAAGYNSSLFLLNDGTVMSVGRNEKGQLGVGTYSDKNIPTIISNLTDVKQIAAGTHYSVFLLNDGTVKATGYNGQGALGNNTNNDSNIPVTSNINNVKQIAAGASHSVFLLNDGTVKTCGENANGQMGDGTQGQANSKKIPTTIPNLTNVKQVSAGVGHSLFLLEDGTVKGVGLNMNGELGDGKTSDVKNTVINIPNLTDVKQVVAGAYHSVFIKKDNTINVTGYNRYGQLGDGTLISKYIPITISLE